MKLCSKTIESFEEPRNAAENLSFWFRCLMSHAILVYCFAVILAALLQGKTTVWDGVLEAVSVILFFVIMPVVGLLEGMQIAFFAVAKLRKAEQGDSTLAIKTCELLFNGKGHNLPGFMIGRQLWVESCFFIIARVTTLDAAERTMRTSSAAPTAYEPSSTPVYLAPSSQQSLGLFSNFVGSLPHSDADLGCRKFDRYERYYVSLFMPIDKLCWCSPRDVY
jgi:hypothetical protein